MGNNDCMLGFTFYIDLLFQEILILLLLAFSIFQNQLQYTVKPLNFANFASDENSRN